MDVQIVVESVIEEKIMMLRGRKVMLDRDLAKLYGVETKVLNRAVKRNLARFPSDFMFQMSRDEFEIWKCQIGTSNSSFTMGVRKRPYAFTEQGIAMLSSVLRSQRAVQVNIAIMRTFVRLREMLSGNKNLTKKLEEMESRYDKQFRVIFDAIREMTSDDGPQIGFKT
ncbi:ORF6N domain-containing protein [Candidatus Gracilibacteria bacterium]|nr:ORF6N domain-containing protein [Candidatus Gracilibacteria bacterium]